MADLRTRSVNGPSYGKQLVRRVMVDGVGPVRPDPDFCFPAGNMPGRPSAMHLKVSAGNVAAISSFHLVLGP